MRAIQLNNNFKVSVSDTWDVETDGNVISLYNALDGVELCNLLLIWFLTFPILTRSKICSGI